MIRLQQQTNSTGTAKIVVLVIVGLLILLSTAQIFLAARVATTGEEIRQLESQRDELALRTNRLQAQINLISSLTYLEAKAREELGMIDATGRVTYLDIPAKNVYASR